jgi:ABC-type microcin C transport system permease subunit YejB
MKNSLNLVLVILFFLVIGCNCGKVDELVKQIENNSSNSTTTSTPATDSTPSTTSGGLTMAKYNQIKEGMSYKEVSDILGGTGTEQMSSGTGKYKVTSYKWEEGDLKWITVIFMGDKMSSKVQYGVK